MAGASGTPITPCHQVRLPGHGPGPMVGGLAEPALGKGEVDG